MTSTPNPPPAIDKLIANADAPSIAVAVLNALSDGSLVATDAGKVLIQTDDGNKDPLTNKTVEAPDAQPVTLEQSAGSSKRYRRRVVGASVQTRIDRILRSAARLSTNC